MKYKKTKWGWQFVIASGFSWWLKVLFVKKGQRTSLQYHHHRNEWHLSLKGVKKVPRLTEHRMTEGLYIEFAKGLWCSEQDIVRLEDDYGRV